MDEWIEKMRTRYLSGHAEPWSREDLERLFPQANILTSRGSREFGDTRHLHHHNHQPDTEDLFERFLSSSRLQDFVDGRRQVDDIWGDIRRGGGGGGSSGGGGSIGHTGSNDMFANISGSDRQSHGRQPTSSSDIFANIPDSDRQFHGHQLTGGNDFPPDIDWELNGFEHQLTSGNDIPPDIDWELDGFENQSAGGNDTPPDLDWELDGSGRLGNDLHWPGPFEQRFSGSNGRPEFQDRQLQGIDDIFGGHQQRSLGLLEGPLFGDRIFSDREPRPYTLHRQHSDDNIFSDLSLERDRWFHRQRAIGWRDDALGGGDDPFGGLWDGSDQIDNW